MCSFRLFNCSYSRGGCRRLGQRTDCIDILYEFPRKMMATLQVAGVVVAEPSAPFSVLPYEHFERQVDTDGRCRRQQRCPGLRVAENDELHRLQSESSSARVATEINSREYGEAPGLRQCLNAHRCINNCAMRRDSSKSFHRSFL